jgi:hypothetical protein
MRQQVAYFTSTFISPVVLKYACDIVLAQRLGNVLAFFLSEGNASKGIVYSQLSVEITRICSHQRVVLADPDLCLHHT